MSKTIRVDKNDDGRKARAFYKRQRRQAVMKEYGVLA